ncbi:hypothetical protein MKW94_011709 [Papaver nudicaule]|uniref:Uncharacterized protein n=1 Tax=Papaver nudicaule TaxID=74823 RepID=A0AA41W0E6_PAPNU|nr:hypothetical protein [Papaver nudicaule]
MKIKDEEVPEKSDGTIRKKITSRKNPLKKKPQNVEIISNGVKSQSCSPEKEDRYYTKRGSVLGYDDNGKIFMEAAGKTTTGAAATGGTEDKGFVWPKLFISLSTKEKEEDFMAMKGCKLPQRPKKRAKFVQRSLRICILIFNNSLRPRE